MSPKQRPILEKGATIGVVSTAFAVRRRELEDGVAWLESRGYDVRVGRHALATAGYLAGSDAHRAEDLRRMILDPDIRAIWFGRGGYGTARLLEHVPWAALRRDPKPLIGYSDLTALFAPAIERAACPCLYGPVVAELGDADRFHLGSLRALLAGRSVSCKISKHQILVPGRAEGRLMGGTLAVLGHLCGTRFMPDLRGSILFLEEIGEEVYRLDRILNQLKLSGAFRGLAGVLLGGFIVPPRRRFPPDRPLEELLLETFGDQGVPVIREIPAGHVRGKWTLPLGGTVKVQTRARRLTFSP